MRRIALILAASLLAATAVTGCRSRIAQSLDTTPNAGPCPVIGSVYDAARYVKFVDGSGELYTDIEFTGEITDVRIFCRYTEDNPLDAEIEIDFAYGKGPAARGDSHVYPYFVAVTRRNGKVLARETFASEGEFRGNTLTSRTERVNRITIPRADASISGVNFEILVGFELTPEQLEFNRAGKRFRLDAGSGLSE